MKELFFAREVDPAKFGTQPDTMVWQSWTDTYSIPWPRVQEIQLEALQTRFRQMVEKIPVLATLAEEQGVKKIERIEDGAPLLFPHSFYKSYPLSFIEKARYDRLTQWLDNLTVHDLSLANTDGIDTIDAWVALLDRDTPVRLIHTTGTSGKFSFFPRSLLDYPSVMRNWRLGFEGFGGEPDAKPVEGLETIPVIGTGYRKGAVGICRMLDAFVDHMFDGDESMVISLNPGRLSVDILSLGARILAAEAKGESGLLQIPPELMARRDKFIEEQKSAPERTKVFFASMAERFAGQRVIALGSWLQLFDMAEGGRANGLDHVFSSDTLVWTAGGTKGRKLPADYKVQTAAFYGVPKIYEAYGMSEINVMMPLCPHGHYHVAPWTIAYVLEPRTGVPFPRTGKQTGRLGLIDLVTESRWGGVLSGDNVTLHWGEDRPCRCGRIGPYLEDNVRRLSEMEGGDDKVACAGAPEAVDKALSFLSELE